MPWIQLIIPAAANDVTAFSDALLEIGAVSVTLQDAADQPLLEPPPGATPLWNHTRVMGLFDAGVDPAELIQRLAQRLGRPLPHWQAEPLEDRDWVRAWMDDFQPMQFGSRLWIVPGEFTAPDPEAVNIVLDPGLAFGTGTHPTTRLCLEWLDAHPPRNQTVIDYGCGSGILALAASKLGARQVLAVDNDPQALLATRDNMRKNSITQGISVHLPDELPAEPVELLLANILAGPLISLAPRFARQLRPGGQIVLSGILHEQMAEVLAAYQPAFEISLYRQLEEWVCLQGTRT